MPCFALANKLYRLPEEFRDLTWITQEDPQPDVLPPLPAISIRPDPSSHVLLIPMCGLQ